MPEINQAIFLTCFSTFFIYKLICTVVTCLDLILILFSHLNFLQISIYTLIHTLTISTILKTNFFHFCTTTRLLWLMFLGWSIAVIHSAGPFGSLLLHVSHRLARQLIVFYILNSYCDKWLTCSPVKWWPIDHWYSKVAGRPYRTLGRSGWACCCLGETYICVLFSFIIFLAHVRLIFLLLLDSLLCWTTLLSLPLMIQSLCLLDVPAWSWLSEYSNHTFLKKTTKKTSLVWLSLSLPRLSLNSCMNPVSAVHCLSLPLYPFCPLHFVFGWQPWNTASFPQLFSREPQMKRYCQPFLSHTPLPINADKRLPYNLWPF